MRLGQKPLRQSGRDRLDLLRRDARARIHVFRQEDGRVGRDAFLARRARCGEAQQTPLLLVGRRALRENRSELRPFRPVNAILDHRAPDRGRVVARRKSERVGQTPDQRFDIFERRALRQRRIENGLEAAFQCFLRYARQRRAQKWIVGRRREGLMARQREKFGALEVFGRAKFGRHIRLERKEMQHALAESVDRLDLQSARRFDGGGEQFSCDIQVLWRLGAGRTNFRAQAFVVVESPSSEHAEHARRHVGGRRLGEGQTDQPRRRDAGQQQPHDALREHMRLAGARMRRHPRRDLRIGRALLIVLRSRGDRISHSSSPAPPPEVDHSLTRARWSKSPARLMNCASAREG